MVQDHSTTYENMSKPSLYNFKEHITQAWLIYDVGTMSLTGGPEISISQSMFSRVFCNHHVLIVSLSNTVSFKLLVISREIEVRVEGQSENCRDIAKRVFSWVRHACRPLFLKELQHAILVAVQPWMTETGHSAWNDSDIDDGMCWPGCCR